ncbi:MAG: tRNA uracil 4-sulfurtransferase ThiI [Peptoniphilaceae bacterium]|nr:tRNA uracil 4-sulfurtransferase ThiI [Peptoniphilaceae bacterium]
MENTWVIAVSFGELILKGKNRGRFIANAERHIRAAVKEIPVIRTFFQQGKYFVEIPEEHVDEAVQKIRKVFGIIYVTPSLKIQREKREIVEAAALLLRRKVDQWKRENGEMPTFKVRAKRSDKSFPMTSPEIAADIGGELEEMFSDAEVDVRNPDITVLVEIREDAFVSIDRWKGLGGLPGGSGGRGLLLLSGGIDSPAAGFAMARRGLALGAIHFHSYPFTSERAKDKAVRLAKKLVPFVGPMQIYMINLTDTYTSISRHAHKKNTTVLSRRMMMRIAEHICDQYDYDALITGESLGQVASQTIQGIHCVNAVATRPILRPFIASDKTEIIRIAREIDTYDISIEPYDDCCSFFAPAQPNTKPRLTDMEKEEEGLDIEDLMKKALASMEIISIE